MSRLATAIFLVLLSFLHTFQAKTQDFWIGKMLEDGAEPKIYLEWDMNIGPGDSGTSLFRDAKRGELVVLGIVAGVFNELFPELAPSPDTRNKTFGSIVRASHALQFLKQTQAGLDLKTVQFDCRHLLSAPKL